MRSCRRRRNSLHPSSFTFRRWLPTAVPVRLGTSTCLPAAACRAAVALSWSTDRVPLPATQNSAWLPLRGALPYARSQGVDRRSVIWPGRGVVGQPRLCSEAVRYPATRARSVVHVRPDVGWHGRRGRRIASRSGEAGIRRCPQLSAMEERLLHQPGQKRVAGLGHKCNDAKKAAWNLYLF